MNGWDVALTIPHIYQGLGITADASGDYSTALEQYNYMIGPQYKWEFNKFRFIAHGLYGRAQTRLRQPGSTFIEPSDRQRALALGGEIDVPISDRFSVRAMQADYLAASAFGSNRNSFRISTGLIVQIWQALDRRHQVRTNIEAIFLTSARLRHGEETLPASLALLVAELFGAAGDQLLALAAVSAALRRLPSGLPMLQLDREFMPSA